jgi:hypothetical protein
MREREIRVAAGRRLPVSLHDGFDYITDPRNWIAYWPRAISVDPDTRWQRPGDRARITLRLAGRRVALEMRLGPRFPAPTQSPDRRPSAMRDNLPTLGVQKIAGGDAWRT